MKIKGRINAVILASGMSKRMGKNKLFLSFNGKTFIESVVDKVITFDFNKILIVTSYDEVLKMFSDRDRYKRVEVVKNYHSVEGISYSIKLGVKNSRDCDGYMFFTVDQPFLSELTIEKVLNKFDSEKIIVPLYGENKGMPTLFPKAYKKKLLALSYDVGGREIIKKEKNNVEFIEIESLKEGIDIDIIDEYKKINDY